MRVFILLLMLLAFSSVECNEQASLQNFFQFTSDHMKVIDWTKFYLDNMPPAISGTIAVNGGKALVTSYRFSDHFNSWTLLNSDFNSIKKFLELSHYEIRGLVVTMGQWSFDCSSKWNGLGKCGNNKCRFVENVKSQNFLVACLTKNGGFAAVVGGIGQRWGACAKLPEVVKKLEAEGI